MKKRRTRNTFNDPNRGFNTFTRNILIALIALILTAMAVTYIFVVSKYGSIGNMFLGESTSQTSSNEANTTKKEIKDISGSTNILLTLNSSGGTIPYGFFLLKYDFTNNNMYLTSLPIYTKDDSGKTLYEQFKIGGPSQIELSAESLFDIEIDRYISFSQRGLRGIIAEYGDSVTFDVPEDVSYSTIDFSISLPAGKTNLNGDSFAKLIRYPEWKGGGTKIYTRQCQLIAAAINQLFIPSNITGNAEVFAKISDYFNSTNITTDDYIANVDAILYAASADIKDKIIEAQGVYDSASETAVFTYSNQCISDIHMYFSEAQQTTE